MSLRSKKKAIATTAVTPPAYGPITFSPKNRAARLVLVLVGIMAGQAILYGPSLVGEKILLPLDILALPRVYLPRTPEVEKIIPHDAVLADLVLGSETARRFTA